MNSRAWRATRSRPPCLRTEFISREGRSNITGPAASSRRAPRNLTRSSLFAATRRAHAKPPCNAGGALRRTRGGITEPLAEPRLHLGRLNDWLSPLFPAGFYYKTFMWPRTAWARIYEPLIRAAAGLGRAPKLPDPDRYEHRFAHCDVLVAGSGPAGLAAALAAADSGARVVLCDEQSEFGGSLLGEAGARIDGLPAEEWLARCLAVLAGIRACGCCRGRRHSATSRTMRSASTSD